MCRTLFRRVNWCFLLLPIRFPSLFLQAAWPVAKDCGNYETWATKAKMVAGHWTKLLDIDYTHKFIFDKSLKWYIWKPVSVHNYDLLSHKIWDSLLSRYSEITSDQIEKENLPQKLTRPMMTDRLQVRYFSLSCIGLYCHIVILLPHSVSHFFRCLAHRLCLPVALNQRLRPLSPFCYSLLNYHQ